MVAVDRDSNHTIDINEFKTLLDRLKFQISEEEIK